MRVQGCGCVECAYVPVCLHERLSIYGCVHVHVPGVGGGLWPGSWRAWFQSLFGGYM